ncbi:MAG TPA: ATP-binding protein [Thermoanaerobaculia bacterium]|nr:ATP-binding protein [Thermoanaerobaculia bacterium]
MALRTWSVLALLAMPASAAGAGAGPLPPNPRYAIQHVGEGQGFGSKTAISLHQDRKGFLWIGTESDGFLRYDGARFERVSLGSGQRDNYAYGMLEAPDGRIYLVTAGGTGEFDGLRVRRLPGWIPAGACERPFALAQDGTILFGRRDGLFTCHPSGDCTLLWPEAKAPGEEAQAVAVTSEGLVFFASGPRLFRLSDGIATPVAVPVSADDRIVALVAEARGGLLIRTKEHLLRREKDGAVAFDDDGLAGTGEKGAVPFVDRAGVVWVPTAQGLFRKAGGRWRAITTAQGLASNAVAAVTEDREGALWIGLIGSGLDRWPGRDAWSAWSSREGLPDDIVFGIVRDAKGRLFVGTNQGLTMWDGSAWRVWDRESGLHGVPVTSLALADDGAVWAKTNRSRIVRVDSATLKAEVAPFPPGVDEKDSFRLVRGPPGKVLVTTRSRLFRVLPGRPPRYEEIVLPGEKGQVLNRCVVWADDTIWCSVRAGLYRGEPRGGEAARAWRLFAKTDGIDGTRLALLALGRPDQMWLTYTNRPGVARFSFPKEGPVEVKWFTRREGLPSDVFFDIHADDGGNLWAAGNSGLGRIGFDGTVRDFNQADGLIWDDTDSDSFLAEADGTLLFGTSRGLARYDPEKDSAAHSPPPVVLTAARLAGRNRIAERGVEVPWKERVFVAGFAGPTFRSPDRVRFLYRLFGLQEEAVETSSREVRFDSLPAGRYRFEVTCRSAAGLVSAKPETFSFVVLPPWWQTWWFRAAAAALALLFTSGVTTLVQRARTRRLVAIERVRTRIATDLHDDLGSSLTEISIVSGVLQKRVSGDPDATQLLSQIGETSRGLSAALSDCIWSVDPRKDDLGSLIERLRQFARDVFSGSETTWRVEEPEGASAVALTPAERRGIYLLVKEALHNVVKHAGARDVTVAFRRTGHRLEIEVVDDGKGFAREETSGEGHGLRSMAARAESLGGTLRIEPGAPSGTRVAAVVPLEEA